MKNKNLIMDTSKMLESSPKHKGSDQPSRGFYWWTMQRCEDALDQATWPCPARHQPEHASNRIIYTYLFQLLHIRHIFVICNYADP